MLLLCYCRTIWQYVEREDISTVTWALTSKEWNLIGPRRRRYCWKVRPKQTSGGLLEAFEMSAPARGWLTWCKLFSCCVDPSSRQGFFIVSRFDFVSRFLSSADLSFVSRFRKQIFVVSSFSFCQQILSADFLSKQSPFCQPILSTDFSYQTFF